MMKIACCVWALSMGETDVLRQVRALGFDLIDIQPSHQRTLECRLLAQELGLRVSCVGASFGMPAGASLDQADAEKRQAAVDHVSRALADAAALGADMAYVIPGADGEPAALERYGREVETLAVEAARLGLKLAVEHFPGTALPTAAATLEFIRQAGRDNLYLLYDSGHIQMTGEDPAAVIANAGDRLGYVHFDDNDGLSDLHWPLLDGVMTEESLLATLRALDAIGYQGALSLELSPALKRPEKALKESRDALLRAMHHAMF